MQKSKIENSKPKDSKEIEYNENRLFQPINIKIKISTAPEISPKTKGRFNCCLRLGAEQD